MPLTQEIREQLNVAIKGGDTARRDALRLIIAAFGNARIAARHDLDDDEAVRVLQREAKQRRDSIEEFRKGSRPDLIAIEERELAVIESFLPAQLEDVAIVEAARAVIAEADAQGPGDVGKVMGPLLKRLEGRADGRRVNQIVRELLAGATAESSPGL
jgi:uncharacterized protein YqeY